LQALDGDVESNHGCSGCTDSPEQPGPFAASFRSSPSTGLLQPLYHWPRAASGGFHRIQSCRNSSNTFNCKAAPVCSPRAE
jgi:hypothetical protein